MTQVNRNQYLRKELRSNYSDRVIDIAIKNNPAYAGISRDQINKLANQAIDYETNKVSTISFAAGLPGGFAMAATIPADLAQYFTYMLRIMQKLAYLYGFPDFRLNEDEVSDETMNQILIFLGVMFGVQAANSGVKIVAQAASQKITKSLAQKALTKGTIYPIVKKVAQAVGIKMTKQIFAKGVGKIVPVVGGFVNGGLTYFTFKPNCKNLQKSFQKLNISDPAFYKNNCYENYGFAND